MLFTVKFTVEEKVQIVLSKIINKISKGVKAGYFVLSNLIKLSEQFGEERFIKSLIVQIRSLICAKSN